MIPRRVRFEAGCEIDGANPVIELAIIGENQAGLQESVEMGWTLEGLRRFAQEALAACDEAERRARTAAMVHSALLQAARVRGMSC